MEFKLLGPLQIDDGIDDLTPSAPKMRVILALLALRNGSIVQTDELIDVIWGEDPPVSALPTLQTYIYKLRRMLNDRSAARGGTPLATRPYGYSLMIRAEDLDVWRFENLLREGRAALEDRSVEEGARLLGQALSLWRGPPLADICTGGCLSAHVARLEESKLAALELHVEADLQLGRHRALVSELKALVRFYPLHEPFHAQLILALHRSGRRYEALTVYRHLRDLLIDQLGLEPSRQLRTLHHSVLVSDPSIDPSPTVLHPVTLPSWPDR